MDWQTGMNSAIEYIESNLTEEIDIQKASRLVGCSVWEFERFFSFLTHISLGEYIRNRRLSCAVCDIRKSDSRILDIALKYGYESHAAFTRAFTKLYGITPTSVRSEDMELTPYPRIDFQKIISERMEEMNKYSQRGYVVRENGPVYFTKDMDKTLEWFENVLGWYGDVAARNQEGQGEYGCVFDYPGEVAVTHIVPFRGFHLFSGEPVKGVVGFLMIEGLEAFHSLVRKNGWEQITDIYTQPWGARECSVTTVDGCILRFFESENQTKL